MEFNFVLKKLVFLVFIRRGTGFEKRKNPSKFALSFLFCRIYGSHMKTSSSLLSITSQNLASNHRRPKNAGIFLKYLICIGNSMVSSAIWEKHARVSF